MTRPKSLWKTTPVRIKVIRLTALREVNPDLTTLDNPNLLDVILTRILTKPTVILHNRSLSEEEDTHMGDLTAADFTAKRILNIVYRWTTERTPQLKSVSISVQYDDTDMNTILLHPSDLPSVIEKLQKIHSDDLTQQLLKKRVDEEPSP